MARLVKTVDLLLRQISFHSFYSFMLIWLSLSLLALPVAQKNLILQLLSTSHIFHCTHILHKFQGPLVCPVGIHHIFSAESYKRESFVFKKDLKSLRKVKSKTFKKPLRSSFPKIVYLLNLFWFSVSWPALAFSVDLHPGHITYGLRHTVWSAVKSTPASACR